uniref:Uncharacterized protein n=1 Tax=Anguilla anguilla TaxID=7936 RepID=A0A0E9VX94_ANGAN
MEIVNWDTGCLPDHAMQRAHTVKGLSPLLLLHPRSKLISQYSRCSSGSHASAFSDLQFSLLEEKHKRDELEELKRQREEEKELHEQCKEIDE